MWEDLGVSNFCIHAKDRWIVALLAIILAELQFVQVKRDPSYKKDWSRVTNIRTDDDRTRSWSHPWP